jgi:hypothetical protein
MPARGACTPLTSRRSRGGEFVQLADAWPPAPLQEIALAPARRDWYGNGTAPVTVPALSRPPG